MGGGMRWDLGGLSLGRSWRLLACWLGSVSLPSSYSFAKKTKQRSTVFAKKSGDCRCTSQRQQSNSVDRRLVRSDHGKDSVIFLAIDDFDPLLLFTNHSY